MPATEIPIFAGRGREYTYFDLSENFEAPFITKYAAQPNENNPGGWISQVKNTVGLTAEPRNVIKVHTPGAEDEFVTGREVDLRDFMNRKVVDHTLDKEGSLMKTNIGFLVFRTMPKYDRQFLIALAEKKNQAKETTIFEYRPGYLIPVAKDKYVFSATKDGNPNAIAVNQNNTREFPTSVTTTNLNGGMVKTTRAILSYVTDKNPSYPEIVGVEWRVF